MKPSYFKLLSRLRFLQVFRSKNRTGFTGIIVVILYFWLLEFILFFSLRGEELHLPPFVAALICFGFLVMDFVLKLIFERDNTVMDAFLKTRPIPQDKWEHFLIVSQCWKPSNLQMPLSLLPACFLFVAFPWSVVLLLMMYALSVFGGFLIMLIKHRGNYEAEKNVTSRAPRSFRQGHRSHVFGLQSRSFLRSKRLKTGLLFLSVFFLLQYIAQGKAENESFATLFLFYFIVLTSTAFTQYGMGIEARFFSCIWTKPLSLSRVLMDKYLLSALMGVSAALISLPFCLWLHTPVYVPFTYALFSSGLGSLLMLGNPFQCVPLDLFGKTFFNYQGSSSSFKASTFLGILLIMALAIALPLILPGWVSYLVLSLLGLAGFAIAHPYFRWVERKFLQNKYKYTEKYLSL